MTYLVTPLGADLASLTEDQITSLSPGLPEADVVIVGIGFPDDVHEQPAALILHVAGGAGQDITNQIAAAITAADLDPGATEVLSDRQYENRLFAPIVEDSPPVPDQ